MIHSGGGLTPADVATGEVQDRLAGAGRILRVENGTFEHGVAAGYAVLRTLSGRTSLTPATGVLAREPILLQSG